MKDTLIHDRGKNSHQVFVPDMNSRKSPRRLNIVKVDRLQLKGK